MEAIKFLREAQRMCNEYACYNGCPIYGDEECVFSEITAQSPERLEDIVATVEAWIETHPIKTNAQKLKEMFGNKAIYAISSPNVQALKDWLDEPYKGPKNE